METMGILSLISGRPLTYKYKYEVHSPSHVCGLKQGEVPVKQPMSSS
jgi:hypothetical protein